MRERLQREETDSSEKRNYKVARSDKNKGRHAGDGKHVKNKP
jgi:hypothetical protein